MTNTVTERLFSATVPPQLLGPLSSRGESRKELLRLVLSLYAKMCGGDVTRKLMSHLHQATAAAAQRNAENLRSSMAALVAQPASSAPLATAVVGLAPASLYDAKRRGVKPISDELLLMAFDQAEKELQGALVDSA